MEGISYSAKTLEEAITKACIDLAVTSENLEYEVLDPGSKGVFGFGAKPCIIKAKAKVVTDLEAEVFGTAASAKKTEKPAKLAEKPAGTAKTENSKAESSAVSAKPVKTEKPEKPAKAEEAAKASKPEREKKDRPERAAKPADGENEEKQARPERPEKKDRPNKDRGERPSKGDRPERTEKKDNPNKDKGERPAKGERPERGNRPERAKTERRERTESAEKTERPIRNTAADFAREKESVKEDMVLQAEKMEDLRKSAEANDLIRDDSIAEDERPVRGERPALTEEARALAEEKAREFLKAVFGSMDMEVEITSSYDTEQEELSLNLEGPDMGVLIGKRGQTLDSLQYLVSQVVNKHQSSYVRIKLDTENYRDRRRETLETLARNIAQKVKRTKRPVALEPMNPYERRIIHSVLQSEKEISTRSEGEEPYRHIVVFPLRKRH